MFAFRDYKKLVDWADFILCDWIMGDASDYESFQDMVGDIDAAPISEEYIDAFEAFVRAARTSEDAWAIMKDILLEYGKVDFDLMVDRMYSQFLLHCISNDIEGYKRIWSKYHG
ncbi:MAG: hypothetical protein [Caudoviricetes sp.]|nr:MAG: hypothetical protein [Caudoviricetes sp.]